ncbi:sterol desaturase family protein [Deinococcus sp. RM]|uniref:sterol desaturase family protein n=1 Tax=Deinococcus sp. RM TaxID=2316359 RepID=UPI001314C2A0|nr:sterol desaturase family protein [Deinococcus sp. RM]
MANLFLGILLLFVLVIAELLYIHFVEKEPIPWREVMFNLNSGHVMTWVCRGLEIAGFDYVVRHLSLGWVGGWPVVAQWVFTLLAWDLCFYWMHRLHHKYPLLWAVHVVHHEGEHFSLSLGIRNSWYSSLTSLPFFVPLAVLGVPTEQFVLIGALHYFVQFYNHNRVVKKSGWLEHVLVTPSHHRVHHASNPEYRDRNCGGTFAMWDRWFGTFQEERGDIEIRYGVAHRTPSDNPVWANNLPVLRHVLRCPAPRLPTWTRRDPTPLPDPLVALGGFVLFGVLIDYIATQATRGGAEEFTLFGILLLGTVAIAGLFEGRRWGSRSWLILAATLAAFTAWAGRTDAALIALTTAFLAHALLTIWWTRRPQAEVVGSGV